MASIDQRVVQMQFDNATFEKRLGETIKSLDALNATIGEIGGRGSGFDKLIESSRNFDVSKISSGIQGVSKSFLALGTIAATALSRLTNTAINVGVNLVRNFSLAPVMGGFQEYELNMKSIQTILANTKKEGADLDDVNGALDELNRYADQTIYNFAEMTRNIGTFTAAGVELDTSVRSIKGIANLAAISGSTSQQASTAMYQLSQAISTGTLRLQDWNSVVNAGMGGQVFQEALFETGKALQTIEGVPIDQTFDQWTDAGNTFRGSLEDGWLTAEVLTTTLEGFTGEMTEAELAAKGFTAEQIKTIQEMGQVGVEAATKIRTLTQLWDVAQEAVGSGWSMTFRTVVGDFEEATELFTQLGNAVQGYVDRQSNARNDLLAAWRDLGGRERLIEGLRAGFDALSKTIAPIREAFRNIFPAITAERLYEITDAFATFMENLVPSQETMFTIERIFRGVFNALAIGREVVGQIARAFGELLVHFGGGKMGGVVDILVSLANKVSVLKGELVDGGKIAAFADKIIEIFKDPLPYVEGLLDKFEEFWDSLGLNVDVPDVLEQAFDRLKKRLDSVKLSADSVSGVWDKLKSAMLTLKDVLGEIWDTMSGWFSNLGSAIADEIDEADFKPALDAINTALLGGIVAGIAYFLKNGINLDVGGGLFGAITQSFDELTGTLQAMQTEIKANAILKIATAVGILAASVLVLSTIDSADLTKSLGATTAGFAQLIAIFTIVNKLNLGPSSALNFTAMATGITIVATAMLILAGAMKLMATMSMAELGKGLLGVAGGLAAIVGSLLLVSLASGGIVTGALAIGVVASSLVLLASSMKIFASMNWEELGKGFTGVVGGLLAITGTMHLLPSGPSMLAKSVGLLAVGAALNLVASSVVIFGQLSWEQIAKGMVGIAYGLGAIAFAMNLMPLTLPITAAGLLVVGAALNVIAAAMLLMNQMSWEQLGKGLAGIAGALLILAIATNAMSGALLGAVAISVVAVGLIALAKAVEAMGSLSITQLAVGLIGLAGALAILGAAGYLLSAVIPALLGLGLALGVLGAGFALIGIGVLGVGKGLELVAKGGAEAVKILGLALLEIVKAIPPFLVAVAKGLASMAKTFLSAMVELIPMLIEILRQLITAAIDLVPEIVELGITIVTSLLEGIRETFPEVVETGFLMLMEMLRGLEENIAEITATAVRIVIGFIEGLTAEMPAFIDAVVKMLTTALVEVSFQVGKAVPKLMVNVGVAFFEGFLEGMSEVWPRVTQFIKDIPKRILGWITSGFGIFSPSREMKSIGDNVILGFLKGITEKAVDVFTWFSELPGRILGYFAGVGEWIYNEGWDALNGFARGIIDKANDVWQFFGGIKNKILGYFSGVVTWLKNVGKRLIDGFKNAVTVAAISMFNWFRNLPGNIIKAIGYLGSLLYGIGRQIVQGLWNGVSNLWGEFVDWLWGKIRSLPGIILDFFNIRSPSRVFMWIGEQIVAGFALGIRNNWEDVENAAKDMGQVAVDAGDKIARLSKNATHMVSELDGSDPVIRPILDLSNVESGTRRIQALAQLGSAAFADAYGDASLIAASGDEFDDDDISPIQGNSYVYKQTINAPTELDARTIYRNTENLVTTRAEELEAA